MSENDKPDMPVKSEEKSGRTRSGEARMKMLSPDQRKELAKAAASARWAAKAAQDATGIPVALKQGELPIGDLLLDCYVLSDRRRLFHKRGMAKAIGLKSSGGNAFMKTMSRKGLGSVIDDFMWEKINNPIVFKPLSGDPAHGYEADVLIDVCGAILRAKHQGKLLPSQDHLAVTSEILIRSAAKTGIVALIDEATGFIDDKRKFEYREMFQAYIRQECREWSKEFPDQFFDMIYRLYGLQRKHPKSFKHPSFFGNFIRKHVYVPLANSNGIILEVLDEANPVLQETGRRKHRLHQFLEQVGLDALRAQVWQVVGIGSASRSKAEFDRSFRLAFQRQFDIQGEFEFMEE